MSHVTWPADGLSLIGLRYGVYLPEWEGVVSMR
jgi:hypothetical protein